MYPRSMTVSADGSEKAQVPTIIGKLNETSPMSLEQIRTVLKKEISHYGPTTMAFPVTEEFLHYSSGEFLMNQHNKGGSGDQIGVEFKNNLSNTAKGPQRLTCLVAHLFLLLPRFG